MNWFIHSLKNYANFSGRANRREWWIFWLAFCLPAILLLTLENFSAKSATEAQSTIFTGLLLLSAVFVVIWNTALVIPYVAVTVRRVHDIGLSGWWLLFVFVPVVGAIFFLVVTLMRGNKMENAYGNVPTLNWVPAPPSNPDGLITKHAFLSALRDAKFDDVDEQTEAKDLLKRYDEQQDRRFGRSQCFFVTKDFATVSHGASPDYAVTRFRMSEVVAVTRKHRKQDEYSVVIQTNAGEIDVLLSEQLSADFASKLFEQLSQQDSDEAIAAKFFSSNLRDYYALDPRVGSAASNNAWADYRAGLALQHGINCSVNFDAALAFYLKAYQSIPEKDEFLRALAETTLLVDKTDDLAVPLASNRIFESQHMALRLLRASVHADNVKFLTELDAHALADSGVAGKSTLSLMSLEEISDQVAEALAGYKGKGIRFKHDVKMSQKASFLLSKLITQ
jgi:uncharacterized membrane protein YhaH (DUF805 family)